MKGKAVAVQEADTQLRVQEEPLLSETRPQITSFKGKNPPEATVTQGTAPDGGWGWCVVLAGTVCMMMIGTQGPCFGVLFGRRLIELGASPSLATWLFNIQSLIWNLTGPWAGPLTEVVSYRTIATAGSLLAVCSLFFSALVTNPYLLLLTFSLMMGLGGGVTIISCYHMTARYFDKRLGLANGIVMTGGSLGLILMPQLASFLQERYSFRWATFLTGAIILHAPVVTLLLHPVSWHHRAPDQTPQKPLCPPTVNKDDAEKEKSLSQGLIRGSSVPADLLKLGGSLKLEEARPKRLRSGSECQDNFYWLEQRGSVYRLGGSTLMAGSVLTLQDNEVAEERHQEAAKPLNPLRRVWIKFRAQYNLRLMKDPLAVGTALATCLTMTSAVNVFAAIPFVLAEAHYSLQDTAMAMSVAAVVDLFTRMGGAMITDWPKLDVRILYAFGQLIYMTVPYVLMCHSGQWWVVVACMAALGVGLGITYLLDVLLVVRLLGVHRLAAVFGLSQFFRCLAFTAFGPIGGQLREVTGNFFATVMFMSMTVFAGLVLLIFATLTSLFCRPDTPRPSPVTQRPSV